jgi:hypothetical protein
MVSQSVEPDVIRCCFFGFVEIEVEFVMLKREEKQILGLLSPLLDPTIRLEGASSNIHFLCIQSNIVRSHTKFSPALLEKLKSTMD